MGLYVLSQRAIRSNVVWDTLCEFEDLLAHTCQATILSPRAHPLFERTSGRTPRWIDHTVQRVLRRTSSLYHLEPFDLPRDDGPNVLVLIAIHGGELDLLSCIPNWEKRFDHVAAYICDSWGPEIYSRNVHKVSRLFVALPDVVGLLEGAFGVPVTLVPFGANVLANGSDSFHRPLDLMSFGRIPEGFDRAITQRFNRPGSNRIYLRTRPRPQMLFPSTPYEQREDAADHALLFHYLRKSKAVLAFDTLYPGMRQFPYSFVTQRWFYGAAAGCAVVGKRPVTPQADELFGWEDATIELPDDPAESTEVIERFLQDTPRLHAIHRRNYRESLLRHDWRYRFRTMLESLDYPLPALLLDEIDQLQRRVDRVSLASA